MKRREKRRVHIFEEAFWGTASVFGVGTWKENVNRKCTFFTRLTIHSTSSASITIDSIKPISQVAMNDSRDGQGTTEYLGCS
jgi:hypothetical protein